MSYVDASVRSSVCIKLKRVTESSVSPKVLLSSQDLSHRKSITNLCVVNFKTLRNFPLEKDDSVLLFHFINHSSNKLHAWGLIT